MVRFACVYWPEHEAYDEMLRRMKPLGAFLREMDPRVGKDGQMVLYVDESGHNVPGEQGDYFVFAGVLTTNLDGLEKTVRHVQATHYPGRKPENQELKSGKISVPARLDLLRSLATLHSTKVAVHVVVKPAIKKPEMLTDHNAFYKRFFTNLVKTALKGHTHGLHIVTDGHHAKSERFAHMENCCRFVNGSRVLSVTPVESSEVRGVQAADVVAGTLRHYLNDHPRVAKCYSEIQGAVIQDWNNCFPFAHPIARRIC